ncbi:hypothetical protein LMG27177_04453 [Paraburkholderia fynbosensis]|uniref:Uncharacterized protein n=1 Tax=Paraburkholderia fynbosensis TaxID=1200993 RepID=A0A6J5GE08_9BURK|nr:hypothetical protein LMG27177_04453 [Paraburkholderia fynbosensis]
MRSHLTCGPPYKPRRLRQSAWSGKRFLNASKPITPPWNVPVSMYTNPLGWPFVLLCVQQVPRARPIGLSRRRPTHAHCWSVRLGRMSATPAANQSPDNVSSGSPTGRCRIVAE